MSHVEKYINSLVDFTYLGDSAVHRYNLTSFWSFIARIKSRLGKTNAIKTYFSRPGKDFFINKTQIFIDNLFINYLCKDVTIVLDQSISPVNIENTIKYFRSSKIIVVDRDPRDVYIDLVKEKTSYVPL